MLFMTIYRHPFSISFWLPVQTVKWTAFRSYLLAARFNWVLLCPVSAAINRTHPCLDATPRTQHLLVHTGEKGQHRVPSFLPYHYYQLPYLPFPPLFPRYAVAYAPHCILSPP